MKLRLVLLSIMLICSAWGAGTYGPNKVQYKPFEWKQTQTRFFDIYFYEGGDSIAHYAATHLEALHDSTAKALGSTLQQRIPVILHNTHAQFQQTNVMPYPIPEAVGGFTEMFKNRIVIPFDGSYFNLHHVLHHEFVHALTFDMLSGGGRGINTAQKMSQIPLWLAEGTAEFVSLGWDISGEGFMMDAVTSGYASNPVNDFYGFFTYKGGQSFLYFIESVFGAGTVRDLYVELCKGYAFPRAFKRVTRVDLEEAGDIWLRELRRIYWPELGQRTFGKNIARALTDHTKEENNFNVGSSISPDGKLVAFFSDRGNREAIYILNTETEKITHAALESGHVGAHESFQSFTSALGWSPDSKHLALVSKQSGHGVIHILDALNSTIIDVIQPNLEAISSPAFSPDGASIAFAGLCNGHQDIFVIQRNGTNLKQITSGRAAESDPVFSPSGRYIAYSTDTHSKLTDKWQNMKEDVYIYDLQDSVTRRITHNRWSSHDPTYGSNDSLIMYVSNRSGVANIYMQNTFNDSTWFVTNLLAGASSPSWSRDGKLLVFTLFEKGGYDVYLMRDPLLKGQLGVPARSLFIEIAEDSTQRNFWNPLVISNLRSFDTTSLNSNQNILPPESEPTSRTPADSPPNNWEPPVETGLFTDLPKRLQANPVTQPASTRTDSAHTKNNKRVDTTAVSKRTAFVIPPIDSVTFPYKQPFGPDSILQTKPYQAQWSLDQAVAMAGFNNVQGLGGQAALVFSDLMGEQAFTFWFNSSGQSFQDINIFASYEYLPLRPDFGISYLHATDESSERMSYTRYLQVHTPLPTAPVGDPDSITSLVPYHDERTSLAFTTQYPLSVYSRFALSSDLAWRTRTYQRYNSEAQYSWASGAYEYELESDPNAITQDLNTLGVGLSWSFDNALWGWVGPIYGDRLWIGAHTVVPKILQDDAAYWNAELDFRKYFRFFKRYTLASRVFLGMSESYTGYHNPHTYLLGGDSWNLNWHFNDENYHATLDEASFAGWETPLRGFRYHEFKGSRMGLLNLEWRFPLIEYLQFGWPIPLGIRNVMGVLFTDMGGAWDNRDFMENRGWGYGMGWRMNLGIFVLRYSKAWGVHQFSTEKPGARTYWSLGADF